jgi:hypothetical protein
MGKDRAGVVAAASPMAGGQKSDPASGVKNELQQAAGNGQIVMLSPFTTLRVNSAKDDRRMSPFQQSGKNKPSGETDNYGVSC